MPDVKTVWAPCPIPETNNQVGFVQLDRTTAEALIGSGKVEDPMKGEKGITEPYTTCSGSVTPPVAKVPKVVSSKIYANNHERILVEWDVDMSGSSDIRQAISIIIDGQPAIIPNAVTFNGKYMTLSDVFKPGQVITWSYNDQDPNERLESKVDKIEADNQTYSVVNEDPANLTTFVSAEVPVSSGGWHVDVTLSDTKGYASVTSEWEVKVAGKVLPIFVTGHDTLIFQLRAVAGTKPTDLIKKGDVVTVSHKIADSGIVAFTDQPVTNNLP